MDVVPVGKRKIEDFEKIIGSAKIDDLIKKGKDLKGLKVLNISSTAFGGGVAELLYSQVPLMVDLGLDEKWLLINGDTAFYTVTKNIHNGLQGMDFLLTDHMIGIYENWNEINARSLISDADIIIVHDPQPLAMIAFIDEAKRKESKWIWRAHIDLSKPQPEVLKYISRFTPLYDAIVVTLPEFAKPQMNAKKSFYLTPTIDPLSAKNNDLSDEAVAEILTRLSVDKNRPIMTQVSRFDPWKDPFGVIDTYRLVKEHVDDVLLLMVASMASDDPEGWHYFEKTARYAGVDPSIMFFSNVTGVGNVEVNAIQRASDVVIQKSKKEGFGLVVSEAMWKKKPVVGTNVGGIKVQIQDSKNGFLIDSTEEAAEKIVYLFQNAQEQQILGQEAYNHVKKNFLTPNSLENWLNVYKEVA